MAKREIEIIIEYLKDLLEEKGITVDKIILFGSYVKGGYREDSDIDLAIISRDFEGKNIFERARMLGDIEWRLMEKSLIPLDIITLSLKDFDKNISLISQYAKGGEIICGK